MPAELAAAWQRATAAVIKAALPADLKAPETWALFAVLLPHAQAALTDDSDGMRKAADYLGYSGTTRPPGIFTSGCWMPWCGCQAPSNRTRCSPGTNSLTALQLSSPPKPVRPAPAPEQSHKVPAPQPSSPRAGPEASWGTVLATTVRLWLRRRLRRARQLWAARPAWRVAIGVALAAVVFVTGGVVVNCPGPGRGKPTASRPRGGTGGGAGALAAAEAARRQAAAWVASQASTDAVVACDPAMCAALAARAGRVGPVPASRGGGAAAHQTRPAPRNPYPAQCGPCRSRGLNGHLSYPVCSRVKHPSSSSALSRRQRKADRRHPWPPVHPGVNRARGQRVPYYLARYGRGGTIPGRAHPGGLSG